MQQKIPVIEQVNTILVGLIVAATVGYLDLQKGDVKGFVEGLILTPVLAWAGNVMWFRYEASHERERTVTVSHPVKIGLKWGLLGFVVLFAYVLLARRIEIAGPVLGISGMVAIIGLTGILASREAFRKGRQMGREEKD